MSSFLNERCQSARTQRHRPASMGQATALFTRVIDLRPNMQPVNTIFIVLDKGKVERAQATAICYATVADSTAAVTLQLW